MRKNRGQSKEQRKGLDSSSDQQMIFQSVSHRLEKFLGSLCPKKNHFRGCAQTANAGDSGIPAHFIHCPSSALKSLGNEAVPATRYIAGTAAVESMENHGEFSSLTHRGQHGHKEPTGSHGEKAPVLSGSCLL